MISEPTKTFSRRFRGYDPAAVDAHIEVLTTKQQLLLDDVESLRAKLKESGDEATALRKEVAVLTDTSPSPHAMQQRMAKMLRRAVDEVSEMQAEARAEAEELIVAAEAELDAEQRKHNAKRAVDQASQQRIKILEQLMGVYRDLDAVPDALESAYQERKNPPEAGVMVPLDQKVSTG